MFNFELSKLIDNIYRSGKSSILIKVGEDFNEKIEIKATPDGNFDVNDEGLIQLISILYFQAYLPFNSNKRNYKVIWEEKKLDLKDINMIVALDISTLLEYNVEITVFNEETSEKGNELSTTKLCGLIEKMLVYSKVLDSNSNISLFKIYKSFVTALKANSTLNKFEDIKGEHLALYFDKSLIPETIKENLRLRKSILEAKKLGEVARKSVSLIADIEEMTKDSASISKEALLDLLNRFGY